MKQMLFNFKYYFLAVLVVMVLYIISQIFLAPGNFPERTIFEIEKGQTAKEIFQNLEKKNLIKSAFWARVLNKAFNYNRFYPGEYEFSKPVSLYQVLFIVTKRPISYAVLIPEGYTKKQIADRLANYISNFDKKKFLTLAKEGYLFPETYYFYKNSTVEEVLKEMQEKYFQKTFERFGKTPNQENVIIASVLEREARDTDDMKIIAGIYYNRLQIGMPLQADATVLYGQGAWKDRVYYQDLKHDSDYNTYINKGLPVGPISNPGLNALDAAMNPRETDYLYYLTGRDGKMYYAKTFDEHVKNKLKYLR
jgi:UPF0755 protein